MRSEAYFLPQLDLKDDELARPADGALPPGRQVRLRRAASRLAGRCRTSALGPPRIRRRRRPTRPFGRVARPRVLRRARRTARKARGRDLEAAHGQVQLRSISRDTEEERSLNPYALFQDNGRLVRRGHRDLVREDIRTFRSSRIRETSASRLAGSGISACRRSSTSSRTATAALADRRSDRRGQDRGGGDTAWWVERTYGEHGT